MIINSESKVFIPLKNNGSSKVPAETGWKVKKYTAKEISDFENYAFVPPKGYCVLDCDDEEAEEFIRNVLDNLLIQGIFWKTDKGTHYLFKCDSKKILTLPTSFSGRDRNPYKQLWDYKGNDLGHVRIKGRIDPNTIIKVMNDNLVPDLPLCLQPTKNIDLTGSFDIGERDSKIFNNWITQLRRYFSADKELLKEYITNILHGVYNDKDRTIEWVSKIVESSFDKGDITFENYIDSVDNKDPLMQFFCKPKKTFVISAVSNYKGLKDSIIEQMKLVSTDNGTEIYQFNIQKGFYLRLIDPELHIKRFINGKLPNLNPPLYQTIANAVLLAIPEIPPDTNPYEITFINGKINVQTNTFTKGIFFSKNTIPWNYVTNFHVGYEETIKVVDKTFKNWCSDIDGTYFEDQEVQIYEMFGVAMSKITRLDKAFFLLGYGENGKSHCLNLLTEILGLHNISNEDLKDLSLNVFAGSNLAGMLANINGDISSAIIPDVALFKKLTSGDRISAQRKYEHVKTFVNIATLIFGVNNLPRPVGQASSYAYDRRLEIIPFLNSFSANSKIRKEYYQKDKAILFSQNAFEYVIYKSIQALVIVVKNNHLSGSQNGRIRFMNYVERNNHVLQFLKKYKVFEKTKLEIDSVYEEFRVWNAMAHNAIISQGSFYARLTAILDEQGYIYETESTTEGNKLVEYIHIKGKKGIKNENIKDQTTNDQEY